MIDYKSYDNIILDFDGVILDSNGIKKEAIYKASFEFSDKLFHSEFVEYFTSNNGIPRETKIKRYFSGDNFDKILRNYNTLLVAMLRDACLTKNIELFLEKIAYYNIRPCILSGGDKDEIISILKSRNMIDKFNLIMGGPLTKYNNLDNSNLKGKILYIGDSLIDYEVAKKYNFDFIFMYGYTQFNNWKEYFKDKPEIIIIKNFEALTFSHC